MIDYRSRIKRRRRELGLTQEELAKRAKIRQSHLSAIERGASRTVTVDTLTKVARALKCKIGALVDSDCKGCSE